MIQGFFPALLLSALAFARTNEGDLWVKGNPIKNFDGSYDNEESLSASQPSMIAIQYIEAYFNGTVTFIVDGKTQHVEHLIDTVNGIGTFNAFIVNDNLTIRYHQDKQEDLILFQEEALFGDINQTGCYPFDMALGGSFSPMQFPNKTIYSDSYIPNGGTRGYAKNCSYTLQTPSQGTVWAIDVMGLVLEDEETLSINGSLQNIPFQMFYTRNSSNPSVLQRFYSDTEVQIGYSRPNAINSDVPAFRILATTVAVAENCTLAYDKQTFKDATGKFAYILDGWTRPSKEKCTWSVEVPKNKQLRLHFLRCWQGPLSGHSLKIYEPVTQYSWDVPNVQDETVILSMPDNTTFTVSFDWKTDGLHQPFGFDLNYFIEDAGTPSTTTTVSPPPTTSGSSTASNPSGTETSTTLPLTTSSSPCTITLEGTSSIIALLTLSAYCIMSL